MKSFKIFKISSLVIAGCIVGNLFVDVGAKETEAEVVNKQKEKTVNVEKLSAEKETKKPEETVKTETEFVINDNLFLRTKMDYNKGNEVFELKRGDKVEVISKDSKWAKILYKSKIYYASSVFLGTEEQIQNEIIEIAVYREEKKKVEKVSLEEYVVGVVSKEMPISFELEALKAQSLAARTYIIKMLLNNSNLSVPEGADVTDTVRHQVYYNTEDLKRLWGKNYEVNIEKVRNAVAQTSGKILTYNNEPIDAFFFSTSNGYTENSEAYWSSSKPYLKSVDSSWDKGSPNFNGEMTITINEFERKLGVHLSPSEPIGKVLKRTPGGRVELISVNGKELTGRQVRENLGLPSSDFTLQKKGNEIIITTKGYGHGVGMSQYGANGMALEGKNYQDIVTHYYQGINISSYNPLLPKITAKR